ncbi:MAG: RNA polymerase sigma factor [Phycisphaerae bacterium]
MDWNRVTSYHDPSVDDEALIDRVRRGDADGASILTRRYWPAIHRFCATYLGDAHLAEDVAQETFAKLARLEELPTGSFKPWIYKVARNRCLDILRRHQRSPTHHRPIRTGFDVALSQSGPGTRAGRQERRELIREIIATMPADYRDVLTLKYFEGFSRAEIAESLETSEATVKGRLFRASEYLEEALRKHSWAQP